MVYPAEEISGESGKDEAIRIAIYYLDNMLQGPMVYGNMVDCRRFVEAIIRAVHEELSTNEAAQEQSK